MLLNEAKKQEINAKLGERLVTQYIQDVVDTYNTTNGVTFANAHSCANYKDIIGYTHQQFCIDVWTFNVAVWEKARVIQLDILTGIIPEPTASELLDMLPDYDGDV